MAQGQFDRKKSAALMKGARADDNPTQAWLRKNAKARKFVELWLDMVARRESDKGLRWLLQTLRDEFDYPFRDVSTLSYRLRTIYGDRYEAAMKARTGRG